MGIACHVSVQVSIGKQLKQVLDIDSSIRIGYLVHVSLLAILGTA